MSNPVRQQMAGGFEVALLADLHLAVVAEVDWIEDLAANLLQRSPWGLCRFDVGCAWAMATLAINTLRHGAAVHRICGEVTMRGWRNLRVPVVAEHALIRNGAARHRVVVVETGIHAPVAAVFGIPGERKFDQRSILLAMQIGPHMIARAHDLVDRQLFYIVWIAVETLLPAALIVLSIMLREGVIRAGGCVIELAIFGGAPDGVSGSRLVEGVRHPGVSVSSGLGGMALRAGCGVGILLHGGGCGRFFVACEQKSNCGGRQE